MATVYRPRLSYVFVDLCCSLPHFKLIKKRQLPQQRANKSYLPIRSPLLVSSLFLVNKKIHFVFLFFYFVLAYIFYYNFPQLFRFFRCCLQKDGRKTHTHFLFNFQYNFCFFFCFFSYVCIYITFFFLFLNVYVMLWPLSCYCIIYFVVLLFIIIII